MKAIDKFNPELGNKFLTYAAPAIRNTMLDMIHAHESLYEIKVQDEEDGHGLTRMFLNDIIGEDEDTLRFKLIADVYIKSPEQIYIESETLAELHNALTRISLRERTYLRYRYGFDDDEEHTRKETAEHFSLLKSKAKRTEKRALDDVWLELPWWIQ